MLSPPVPILFLNIVLTIRVFLYFHTNIYKAFDCVDHNRLWKILKEMGIPDHLTCLLRNLYAVRETVEKQLELEMEPQTGSKQENECFKAVYCHSADLTYMQSTS